MIRPPYLKQGDTVAIVAPARKVEEPAMLAAKSLLTQWGYNVNFGAHLFKRDHPYFSAIDQFRIDDFQAAISNENVKAIFCARGGHGCTRIIDEIDFSPLLKHPKWICGFSDVTALHLKLHKLGLQSLHSTVPVLFARKGAEPSIKELKHLLEGKLNEVKAPVNTFNKNGESTGRIVGGNLALIVNSLGTNSEIDTSNKILVIEDVGEHFYQIDRMMMHLKRAGKLKNLSGLVVGYFTDIKESVVPFGETVEMIIQHHTNEFRYPVAFNFAVGHEEPNLPFIVGAKAKLNVTDQHSVLSYINE